MCITLFPENYITYLKQGEGNGKEKDTERDSWKETQRETAGRRHTEGQLEGDTERDSWKDVSPTPGTPHLTPPGRDGPGCSRSLGFSCVSHTNARDQPQGSASAAYTVRIGTGRESGAGIQRATPCNAVRGHPEQITATTNVHHIPISTGKLSEI